MSIRTRATKTPAIATMISAGIAAVRTGVTDDVEVRARHSAYRAYYGGGGPSDKEYISYLVIKDA